MRDSPTIADDLTITTQMLADLLVLHRSKPFGCARFKNDWRSPQGTVKYDDAAMLTAPGLARRDYSRRAPRLLITGAGTRLLSQHSPRSIS